MNKRKGGGTYKLSILTIGAEFVCRVHGADVNFTNNNKNKSRRQLEIEEPGRGSLYITQVKRFQAL